MSRLKGLRCRECGAEYGLEPTHVCEFCFGPLEVQYDYEAIREQLSVESIQAGPSTLWRYQPLLPVEGNELVDLGAGWTPFLKADRLGKALGLKHLYLKNDTANPTWSFKDRVVSVALSRAVQFGFDTVACASTGNLGNAVSAHAARAGLNCFVFIPADLEAGKVLGSLIYAPNVVAVSGNYDDVNRLCSEIADRYRWAFVNINIRPYYSEGSKTLAFETVEQLGWRAPDHVVAPIASGSLMTKIAKGLKELKEVGLISELSTRVSGAQAEGCSPVATAFKEGAEFVRPVKPNTLAKSLAIGNPADGFYALEVARQTNGVIESVTDAEVIAGIKLLAEHEGIFTETAGGVTIGVLKKLTEAGTISSDELTVAYITGSGLKTQETMAGQLEPRIEIPPNLDAFEETKAKWR
ncbi:MAG: threonine synthase [Armatimonadetes bacterium CG_4_10_14_3_um_filter_66_18]|nr:threonine synthase [Armatimonadota bacterium]OIP06622.1 MAG: threonine synthase [Armatimonadetes bacterium CG2_30_66_41]PIY46713.1 MAG: threonine synthase [Armatimonadetes bacterium CG_4_10_14_3_um_filter_66_18]PIZ33873.1 MAG: threonine synthase [Armatimonadetes bacterium CG_4_10_14_0_8_um_filter_66_14]PJB62239.1 MAG: threonine synthase [Armatimonadetes bacterium CG_4_9_14_3_um_filter_66_14]